MKTGIVEVGDRLDTDRTFLSHLNLGDAYLMLVRKFLRKEWAGKLRAEVEALVASLVWISKKFNF